MGIRVVCLLSFLHLQLSQSIHYLGIELMPWELAGGKAARNLDFFKNEVTRRGIPAAFKLQGSQQAFDRFVNINVTLLRNLKFNELNEMALTKIMKSKYCHSHCPPRDQYLPCWAEYS